MYSISVVIPNFNGINLLKENIPHVYRALSTSGIVDYEIIVADDASVDGSVSFIRQTFPEIIVVQSSQNRGFAGNANIGIRAAQKELVLILNSDVQLTDGYFTSQLRYFREEDTFGVMGRIVSMTDDRIQDGAKYPMIGFTSIRATKNYTCKARTSLYTFFLSGANALVDRKKLEVLDGFNEVFNPYYAEDVDLGLNAWRYGYKLYYEHTAVCRHPNSATIKKEPAEKVKIAIKRNKVCLHYLHLDGIELLAFIAKSLLKAIFRLLVADTRYLKAVKHLWRLRHELRRQKKRLKDGGKRSLRDCYAH
ncbi:MAG: glycosyltransferase family 2 protein [Prevotellaceae bacterium]|jgi:GT2 family glycosyltransferase|nr:glycosyltransferase family 2 protein [Prevotellaceae bacterium]